MPTPSRPSTATRQAPMIWPAIGYLLFVAYGSLVPLKFHAMPLADAWLRFWTLGELHEVRTSTVDWAVNIVLYVPLTFFWLGALWHRWRLDLRLLASLLALLLGVLLSGCVEFAQLFFAERTSSFNDIVANSLGSAFGVLGWWLFGRRARGWLDGWHTGLSQSHMLEQVLYGYLALLLAYNLMPLDLSISPVEIYHKWKAGMVRLVPFVAMPGDAAQVLYGLLADIGLWVIPAWLARRAGRYQPRQILFGMVLAAAAIEGLQLFVMSRVSDVTSILLAALGSAIGLQLARIEPAQWFNGKAGQQRWWLVLSGWIGVILAALWYPFHFQATWHGAWFELNQTLANAPLAGYYQNSELGALTSMLRKMGLFLPLGLLLGLPRDGRRRSGPAAFAGVAAVAVLVEFGQALQPGRIGDIADWLLQSAGGALGWWFATLFANAAARPVVAAAEPRLSAPRAQAMAAPAEQGEKSPDPLALLLFGAGLIVFGCLMLRRLPGIPYNVRELIDPAAPLRSAILFCLSIYWVAVAPLLATPLLTLRSRWLWSLLLWPLVHGVVAFLLLWLAVPVESIDDIVGSPVLRWPWEWERMARFVGLFAVPSIWLTGAMLLAGRQRLWLDRRATPIWCVSAVFWLQFAYWVVVVQADTDNLVELMADDASWFAASALGGALALFLLAATAAARWFAGRRSRWWLGPVALALALPLVFGLVWFGSEGRLIKYGQVFSALQFLLSSDRAHYVGPGVLLARFSLAYAAAALMLVLVQYPVWKILANRVDRQVQSRPGRVGPAA